MLARSHHIQTSKAVPICIKGDIPIDLNIGDGQRFLFISNDQRAYTHGIHKYPAKFFPELPRWIIRRYSKAGDLVLDPFMGSGTANLEAMLLGRRSVGVDIDPFSRFLSLVKTTPLNMDELLRANERIRSYLDTFSSSCLINGVPYFPYRDGWFKPHVLRELAFIKAGIVKLKCSSSLRNFLFICFSSIIRQTSQADNNCTRTVVRKKLNKVIKAGYAISLFQKRLKSSTQGMLEFSNAKLAAVEIPNNASATDLHIYGNETFELALTSPPYMNAVDYPRTHQLEMYWLGFANGSLRDLKVNHVGTEIVSAQDYVHLHQTGIKTADAVIKSIYQTDPRRGYIAYKFIQDMVLNMQEVYRVLKKGGRYVMVIGSNIIRGHPFETWRYLKDVAPQLGYQVECRFESGIINHFIKIPRRERIEEDHVLVLKKW